MKKLSIALLFVIFTVVTSHASILVFSPNGSYTVKSTLADANTAADVAGKTVVCTTPQTLTANITLATDRAWQFDKGCVITTTGYTFDGNFASIQFHGGQTFTGTGSVIGLKSATPEMFAVNTTPGTTDMSTAIQSAWTAASEIFLQDTRGYYVGSNIAISQSVKVTGPGPLIGPAVTVGSTPSVTVSATGALATGIAFGSTIAIGTKSFTVANSFAPGDLLLLSNYPITVADRRMELVEVATSSGSAFTLKSGVLQTYANTTTLQFQKVTPILGIQMECPIENLTFSFVYTRGTKISLPKAKNSCLSFRSSYQFSVNIVDFDATNTGCLVDVQGMSENFTITGNYRGGTGVSDNGVIKTNGAAYYTVDANIIGSDNGGGYMHGFMADTYYASNPSGYDNQTNAYFKVNINAKDIYGSSVFITSQATPTDTNVHDFVVEGNWGYGGISIVNSSNGVLKGSGITGVLQMNNCTSIFVETDNFTSYNLIGNNTLIEGIWMPYSPTVSGTTGTAPEPSMSAVSTGRYIKKGKLCTFSGLYQWTSAGSRTGNLEVILPFTAKNVAYLEIPLSIGYVIDLTVTNGIRGAAQPGLNYALIYSGASTQQALGASGTISISGTFEVN